MLFNSYVYILAFLPISLAVYWFLIRMSYVTAAKLWLTAASFFFYGWWDIRYVPILAVSILFNYAIGVWLAARAPSHEEASQDAKAHGQDHLGGANRRRGNRRSTERARRLMLVLGIAANVILLGYFKYMDFFIENINFLFHTGWDLLGIVLPIGISFYTFTQIAYLVDAYKGEVRENSLLNYALFVVFFPQLIAGPILHHREMMPQFADPGNYRVNSRNFALGLTVFAAGLVKKVVIADTLAPIASYGFDEATALTLVEAWITSLSYSFQLYLDRKSVV